MIFKILSYNNMFSKTYKRVHVVLSDLELAYGKTPIFKTNLYKNKD